MANDFLPYQNPTTTDERLDTESLTVGALNVHRERVQIAGAVDVAIAGVINAAPTTEYGVVTRNIPSGTQAVSGTVTASGPLTDAQLRAVAVPISGTVTANLAAGTNNIGDVDVLTVPAPLSTTGGGTEATALRVTLASDSTGLVSVDDNGGSLTVDGTVAVSGTVTVDSELTTADLDTGAGTDTRAVVGLVGSASGGGALIPGSATDGLLVNLGANNDVSLNAGTNNIGDVDVLTLPALPAGTNNIGDVDVLSIAAGDNNIGNVDVVSQIPGTGATNLGKAIDAASGATDTGVAVLAIRDDALSALTPIEGDYIPLRVNSTGALHVTGGGGGTEYVVNAVAPVDPTGATFVMERDDALAALTEIEGDWTNPRASANGALWVSVDAALPAGTNNIGDVDILTLPALVAGTANIGDVDVLTVPAPLSTTGGGTEATALRVTLANDSTGLVSVDDNGGSLTVDNGGTFVVQENGAALTALQLIDNAISGAGFNITQQGGVAVSLNVGAVDTGTQRMVQANGAGKTILSTGGSASASGNNTLVAAGTNRLKVFAFSLTTTSATAMTCIFQSGASGTELWRCIIMAPSGANAGANLAVAPPAWLFATASATLLNLNLSSANAVHWSVSYYDEA